MHKITEFVRVVLGHRNAYLALKDALAARKTGSLTVHLGQGGVTSIEWQQRSAVNSEWPFVKDNTVERGTCTKAS